MVWARIVLFSLIWVLKISDTHCDPRIPHMVSKTKTKWISTQDKKSTVAKTLLEFLAPDSENLHPRSPRHVRSLSFNENGSKSNEQLFLGLSENILEQTTRSDYNLESSLDNYAEIQVHDSTPSFVHGVLQTLIDHMNDIFYNSTCNFKMAGTYAECETHPGWSCQNRCGDGPHEKVTANSSFCYCNELCLVYSACCEDFHLQCESHYGKAVEWFKRLDGVYATCDEHMSYAFITHDPFENDEEMATVDYAHFGDFSPLFPVTDSVTGLQFINEGVWSSWWNRGIATGKPLYWILSAQFEVDVPQQEWYDKNHILFQLLSTYSPQDIHKANKNTTNIQPLRWFPPPGTGGYYCNISLFECQHCSEGLNLSRECSNKYLQAKNDLLSQRFCYFCNPHFHNISTYSDTDRCSVSDMVYRSLDDLFFSMYDFRVLVAMQNQGLDIQLLPGSLSSYDWQRLQCRSGVSTCTATSCVDGLDPQDGKCDHTLAENFFVPVIFYAMVCMGVADPRRSSEGACCYKKPDQWFDETNSATRGKLMNIILSTMETCLEDSLLGNTISLENILEMSGEGSGTIVLQFIMGWDASNENEITEAEDASVVKCVKTATIKYLKVFDPAYANKSIPKLNFEPLRSFTLLKPTDKENSINDEVEDSDNTQTSTRGVCGEEMPQARSGIVNEHKGQDSIQTKDTLVCLANGVEVYEDEFSIAAYQWKCNLWHEPTYTMPPLLEPDKDSKKDTANQSISSLE